MRLSSFVKDHIAGLGNLINLALASRTTRPARFLFCSSTASVLGPHTRSPIPECVSHDPLSASPLGYSRSKWVAESICEQAYLHTRLKDRITILRIGQLCGDTESGIWNVTETWPLMLSSVKVTESLPQLEGERLGWLPVDVAAQGVIEISLSTTSKPTHGSEISVYHLLNPSTESKWSDLLAWLQKISPAFDIVPPSTWVSQLDNLSGEAAKHPARKLVGLWKEAYCNSDAKKSRQTEEMIFEMVETKKIAPVMRDVKVIGEEQFTKIWTWIDGEMIRNKSGDVM